MPTGRVPAARLQRKQSESSRSVPCDRFPDFDHNPSNIPPHQPQQNRLCGLNPTSPSAAEPLTPKPPGSPTSAAGDSSDGTEGIAPYYGLAAAVEGAADAASPAGLGKTTLKAESSSSNAASEGAEAVHSQLKRFDQQHEEQQQTDVQIDIGNAPNSGSNSSTSDHQQQQQPCAWREVIAFALPMLATLAADPLASLVDTAFVGHLGAAQLAGVVMAINIFSSITRLFNAPLLAVTTSAVAAAAAESDHGGKCDDKAAAAAAAGAAAQDGARSDILDKTDILDSAGPPRSTACMARSDTLDAVKAWKLRSETLDSAGSLRSGLFESDQKFAPAVAPAADVVVKCSDVVVDIESPAMPGKDAVTATLVDQPGHDDLCANEAEPVKSEAAAQDDLTEPLLGSSSCSSQPKHSKLSAAVSAAIILALSFSLVQVIVLAGNCSSLVSLWGAPAGSPLNTPTRQFLLLRGVAAPVTVLLLVMQGVFRGLQDAKTPFYATLACNALNIALEPPFIFKPLNLGVQGSALATALAQTVPLAALLVVLQRRYKLRFRGLDMKQLGAMFAPTGFLLLRTVSISAVFAAATSLVARAGPLAAAAHQVAFQIWMATSLLADSLAVASQTILARAVAANNLNYARKVAATSITMALLLGCMLSVVLGAAMHALPGLFTQDKAVLSLARQLMPIVAVTQPINALAFVSDGVLYGAGGFKFASGIMLLCAAPSLGLMFLGQVLDGPQRQHRSGQNPLPYTLGDDASRLGFNSSRDLGNQAQPFARVWQQPARQYRSVAAGLLSYSRSSFIEHSTMQLLNEPNNYLGSANAPGAYSSLVSGSGVLSIGEVSLRDAVQGFVAQPSMQGYNSLYSQQLGLGIGTSPRDDGAAASISSSLCLSRVGSTETSSAIAALAVLQDNSSSSSTLPTSSHIPMPAAVYWVWAGMVMLMLMRAATILLPLACRCYPFSCLYKDLREQRSRQQQDIPDCMQPGMRQHSSLSLRSISSYLNPARMWAWLGRGSFFAAGAVAAAAAAPAAAAAAVEQPAQFPAANLASYKRQRSGCSRFNTGSSAVQDDAKVSLLATEEFHCEGSEVSADNQADLGSSVAYKLAAVADEESLLAVKSVSIGIPAAKLSQVHTDHAQVDDSLLVVVCGGDGSSSSLASSSSSKVLGSSYDEQ